MKDFIAYYRTHEMKDDEPNKVLRIMADTENQALRMFIQFREWYPELYPVCLYSVDEQRNIPTERGGPASYRDNIVELIDRQREKGLKKYGQTLEQNTTLSTVQRIEHAQEELVDALQYLEHLKQTQADHLTVADYERAALRTLNAENADRFDGWGIYMEAALGLTGEAGEAVELVKKSMYQGHELDKDALALELGDVAWYLTLFCHAAGLTLEEVLNRNIKKRAERYPEGFDKARSINREEGQNNA